eukprot:3036385-Prymnesium_polylepis.1
MQAIDNETYLGWWGDAVSFYANNTGAEIHNREIFTPTTRVQRSATARPAASSSPARPSPTV